MKSTDLPSDSSPRSRGANRDKRLMERVLHMSIERVRSKVTPSASFDVIDLQRLIAICSIATLMTGCVLPSLPGLRVAADRPSRYYSDGPDYYPDRRYYDNGPQYGDRRYYDNTRYYW